MTDPIHILVQAFAGALISHGHAPMPAYLEAEELTIMVLEQIQRTGTKAGVGVLLRQVRVYELRSRGVSPEVVMARLGISRAEVWRSYKRELNRRRAA